MIFKSLIEIRVVFLEYHGAHIVDLDGKLAAVVCEGARCEFDEAIKERGETITLIAKLV